MVKVMRCHQCQHDFSWDSGNPLVMSWGILLTGGMKEKFKPLTLIVSGFFIFTDILGYFVCLYEGR